ncbi:hypothetical protein HKD42_03615 [Altererythrobacter sp. RZ02]|uniref:Uncharacterized protein n=1 Tax=Pontixanthobacter rizhaonensis TaxID=2730337 RepID=A0A848QKC8_9SPHN|nr:hypothetical protein [Pontixanthobacter rizhaonensis]NMW31143.1 hypothetical protein [Pontixanthobacter rizhaonensis]
MWWGFSGKLDFVNLVPAGNQDFVFTEVEGLFGRENDQPEEQRYSDCSSFAIMRSQKALNLAKDLLDRGNFMMPQPESFAFVFISSETCSLVTGLNDKDFDLLLENIDQVRAARVGCSGIGRFASESSATNASPTESEFEAGCALMLERFSLSLHFREDT